MLKVELDGKEYEVRRLGLSDIFTLNDIITSVLAGSQIRGLDLSDLTSDKEDMSSKLASLLFLGLPFAEQDIKDWLVSLVPEYEGEEIYLPDLMNLMDSLTDHPDITSFLERCKGLLPKILKKLNGKKETPAG